MKFNLKIQIKNKMKEERRLERENQQKEKKKGRAEEDLQDSKESLEMHSAAWNLLETQLLELQ